jgi:hypothetical protein
MQIIKATGLDRKSGGAQWRDLCVDVLSWEYFLSGRSVRRRNHYRPCGKLTL